jgi:aminoglycoside phosphotransferase (APT) family kinase protein
MQNEIRLESLQRLAAGREAEVFAVDAARVLRLGLSSQQRAAVECEALVLAAASAAGAPVPALHGKIDLDGRPGLIIERLGGGDLLTHLDRRPWSVWSVARTLGRLHAQLHAVDGPERLPQLRDRLGARLQSPLVPSDVRERALSELDELPDGPSLCHGDYHPANVLPRSDGFAVIDWGHATRGDPAANVARTWLLLAAGALPDNAPALMRAFSRIGRRLLLAGYLRAYQRQTGAATVAFTPWIPVVAAARLAEDIQAERDTVLALART